MIRADRFTFPRLAALLALLAAPALARAAAPAKPEAPKAAPARQPRPAPSPDFTREKTLYVMGYSHLDTQYRWTYKDTIGVCLPDTVRANAALLDKYPDYVFNFSGANRYRMLKEYFPADYARVKEYVAKGRWFPCGSSMEESDVNVPSAESLVRQVLYGNHYFRSEFGKTSQEFMLPDCFGFPASLPSILAHCGVRGFSTQKLSWHSANGIPFNVGFWEGPDGRGVIAALNCDSYGGGIKGDLSHDADWLKRLEENAKRSDLYVDYHYYGTGDRGGAPKEDSVKNLEASVKGGGPVKVVSAPADEFFKAVAPQQRHLPRYQGDLLLIEHSAGSISSQAYMKRWNRKSELLADAAERASVAAHWLGALPYPRQKLNEAWTLVMGGQFHDILPGTSQPRAYEYSWNDEILAQNLFAQVATAGAGAVARALDTRAQGAALVVYNPLAKEREDVVEASVAFPSQPAPQAVKVVGPDGKEAPAQILGLGADQNKLKILFLARVPASGFAVYDVRPAAAEARDSALKASARQIENARYRVTLNDAGDVASIFDKTAGKELLAAPARLVFTPEKPSKYPAWNMDWADRQKPALGFVDGPATVKVIENGPVRVALEVTRQARGSRFVQRVRLSSGDAGARVEFANVIDWKSTGCALRAAFPLTVANPLATYNWEVGTIQRANNNETKYEVPAHQWFDLTNADNAYGVTMLTDCKYGSDKPSDNEVRLTLIYTPGVGERRSLDQATQDWGRHEILYGLTGHPGDWRGSQWQALRLNQPMLAFAAPAHEGPLGKSFSLASVDRPNVIVKAVKMHEDRNEMVVRLIETEGRETRDVTLNLPGPVVSAYEVNGQERPMGGVQLKDGKLVADLGAYGVRAFALTLGKAPAAVAPPQAQPLALPYNVRVASRDGEPCASGFDGKGAALPAEMLPAELSAEGVAFKLAPAASGKPNAVACGGQVLPVPAGFTRLHLLAASSLGDVKATFKVGGRPVALTIQQWGGYVGQWDNRLWNGPTPETAYEWWSDLKGLKPGFIKPAPVAWFTSHHHDAKGANAIYDYAYLFQYALDLPEGTREVTLPADTRVKILAASLSRGGFGDVRPAAPLLDALDRTGFDGTRFTWTVPEEIAKKSKKKAEAMLKKGFIDKW